MECDRGCDVVGCRGDTTLELHFDLICTDYAGRHFVMLNIMSYVYPELNLCLGGACPCFVRSLVVDCPHLRQQYMFNEFFSCICIGFSEF